MNFTRTIYNSGILAYGFYISFMKKSSIVLVTLAYLYCLSISRNIGFLPNDGTSIRAIITFNAYYYDNGDIVYL